VTTRLVELGVPADKMSPKGFAATRPAEGNTKATGNNARIEVSRLP
jgi:flagellar motor protein MotB